jgi:hypothetical protein
MAPVPLSEPVPPGTINRVALDTQNPTRVPRLEEPVHVWGLCAGGTSTPLQDGNQPSLDGFGMAGAFSVAP